MEEGLRNEADLVWEAVNGPRYIQKETEDIQRGEGVFSLVRFSVDCSMPKERRRNSLSLRNREVLQPS